MMFTIVILIFNKSAIHNDIQQLKKTPTHFKSYININIPLLKFCIILHLYTVDKTSLEASKPVNNIKMLQFSASLTA